MVDLFNNLDLPLDITVPLKNLLLHRTRWASAAVTALESNNIDIMAAVLEQSIGEFTRILAETTLLGASARNLARSTAAAYLPVRDTAVYLSKDAKRLKSSLEADLAQVDEAPAQKKPKPSAPTEQAATNNAAAQLRQAQNEIKSLKRTIAGFQAPQPPGHQGRGGGRGRNNGGRNGGRTATGGRGNQGYAREVAVVPHD